MLRLVHRLAEEHDQPRHKEEHGHQAEEDRLDQTDRHILTDTILHKHHREQTADRGQGAGADLRDCLGQCHDIRFTDPKGFVLFLITVAENNRVVDRQGQLQYDGHRIGYEGNGTHQEIGSRRQDRTQAKGQDQYRHLRPRLRCEEQYRNHDDRDDHADDLHLARQLLGCRIPHGGGYAQIVICQFGLYVFQCFQRFRIVLGIGKRDIIQRGKIIEMVRAVIKIQHIHIVPVFQFRGDAVSIIVGYVHHHDLCRSVGNELVLHPVESDGRLRRIRQICRQGIFHFHPAGGDQGKDRRDPQQ